MASQSSCVLGMRIVDKCVHGHALLHSSASSLGLELAPSLNDAHQSVMLLKSIPSEDGISRAIRMTPGDSSCSYATNSKRQAFVFNAFQPLFRELIRSFALEAPLQKIRIVDLGCATGMNAIAEVEFVLKILQDYIISTGNPRMPEFQVFFNDLPSNDFKQLFSLLKKHRQLSQCPSFLPKALPASFYQILFPRQSMQVALSIMALHWLSILPPSVLDPKSSAFNSGRSWVDGGSDAVGKAYAEQSQRDLRNFFRCRAAELCEGGALWVCMMGRSDSSPPTAQVDPNEGAQCGPEFEAAWDDIVSEGLVDRQTRDRFNLPWYFPNAEEVRKALELQEDRWEVMTLEVVKRVRCMDESDFREWTSDAYSFGVRKAEFVRSFTGSLIEEAVGTEVSEIFFSRLAARSTEFLQKSIIRPTPFVTVTVVGLRRK